LSSGDTKNASPEAVSLIVAVDATMRGLSSSPARLAARTRRAQSNVAFSKASRLGVKFSKANSSV
jgi:hypothetical protein